MNKAIISFRDFNFRYDSQLESSLTNINFDIFSGETILIIGPSGSGKSTLGKAINGQIPHSFPGEISGQVVVNGINTQTSSLSDLSLNTGTVLQDSDGQFVALSVAEDLAFSLENDVVPQENMKKEVEKWSKILDLNLLLTNRPQELSGGQKQRVAVGGVLINKVPILLFDEPLANLDPKSGQETIKLIQRISRELDLTTIIIEHRLEECLLANIDRVLVMSEGLIVENSSVDQLLKSNILKEVGLREPLYIDALKKANVPLNEMGTLKAYEKTSLPQTVFEKVEKWATQLQVQSIPKKQEIILDVKDVSFSYPQQKTPSLSKINFQVNRQEMVSIVGTNGAGKSTMAKLICGFERPKIGEIWIEGIDIANLSIKEVADRVGLVMQNPNAMISKNIVFDEVALGLVNRAVKQKDIELRVNETLKNCGLYPYRNWPISALSYGQKRRVTIASILILQPDILILDEPTAGQDYQNYSSMMEFINFINQTYHSTILMITHDMHLMQEYTDRTLVFDSGQLIADTSPQKLFSSPDIIDRANLVPTSLYLLGEDLPTMSSYNFLEKYIANEREGKRE